MAIKQLTEEQIRDWTLEQKDRWWLENVYKGNMPQLTIRSAATGFLLGGILSATNLYIGAKTGWSLGVGVTSVILAFAMFKVLTQIGWAKEFTILENNAMQSIATAAGYMTAPLISSLVAYMIEDQRGRPIAEQQLLPWWQIISWNLVVSVLGVLFAFPMKRRFINDEQHPFPEGRAAGVVMDTLHSADAAIGMAKAKALFVAAAVGAGIKFLASTSIHQWFQFNVLRQRAYDEVHDTLVCIPEKVDGIFHSLGLPMPKLWGAGGTDARQLTLTEVPEVALMAAGGLMGIRGGVSLIIGAVLNFCILAPLMIWLGDIKPKAVLPDGTALFGFRQITLWSLWPGVACMVVASLAAFFAKPKMLIDSFRGLTGKKQPSSDVLKDIELPSWVSLIGIPVLSLLSAFLANWFFGVDVLICLIGLPLTFVLSLVAANSTALTSTTPVGATSKITQLFYGAVSPKNINTNLATAGLTAEVVSNSSNLLMDIKPGYMLGAKPRQQAIGHIIGIISGSIASVPLFYLLFTRDVATKGVESLQSDKFPMPSVTVWRAVAKVLTEGLHNLPQSVIWACGVGALVGLALEMARMSTKGRFPLSPVGLGLAFVLDFKSSLAMFLGSLFFWWMGVGREHAAESEVVEDTPADAAEEPHAEVVAKTEKGPKPNYWVDNHEPLCAGVIAGAALVGILDAVVAAFLL